MVKLDKHAKLDMRMLQRAGFFDYDRYVPLSVNHVVPYYLTCNDAGTAVTVELIYYDKYYKSTIELLFSSGGFGKRAFFKCPSTGLKCRTLYFHQGIFKSRSAVPELSFRNGSPTQRKYAKAAADRSRLLGTDGRAPARGENRRKILDRLSQDGWSQSQWPEIFEQKDRLARGEMVASLRKVSSLKTGALSTKTAIRRADEVPFVVMEKGLDLPWLHELLTKPDLPKDDIGNFPVIDLPTIVREMKSRNVETSLFDLSWDHKGQRMVRYALVDIRLGWICGIEIGQSTSSGDLEAESRARIWWTEPGKPRFICPYTGVRVDSLFMRDRYLGSANALNLRYLTRGPGGVLGPQIKSGKRTSAAARKVNRQRRWSELGLTSDKEAADLFAKIGGEVVRQALAGHYPSMKTVLVALRWGEDFQGVPELMSEKESGLFATELRAAKDALRSPSKGDG